MHRARRRQGALVAVGLFVLAFGARVGVGARLLQDGPASFVLTSDDGDAYDAAARWQAFGAPVEFTPRLEGKWATERSVMDRWPQGYWLFLAAQYALWGSAYVSTILLQALLGAGGVLAGYALARGVLSELGAGLAGVGLAFSSTGVYLAGALYAESLYIPCLLGGLALAARSRASGRSGQAAWALPALAGVAFGLGEATRPLALPVVACVLGWYLWPAAGRTSSERARSSLALSLGFVLGIAPFLAHDLAVLGRITTFTIGGPEAFADLQSGAGTRLPDRLLSMFGTGGWAPLGEPLVSTLGVAAVPLRLSEALLAGLGIAGLIRGGASARSIGWLVGVASLAIVLPPLFLGLPLVRYRAAADPLMIVAMVAALEPALRVTSSALGRRAAVSGCRRAPRGVQG